MKQQLITNEEKELNTQFNKQSTLTDNQLNESGVTSDVVNPSLQSINLMQEINNQCAIDEKIKIPILSLNGYYFQDSSCDNMSTQASFNQDNLAHKEQYEEYKPPQKNRLKRQRSKYQYQQKPINAFCIQYQEYENEQQNQANHREPWHLDCLKCLYYLGILVCIMIVANYLFSFFFKMFEGTEQND